MKKQPFLTNFPLTIFATAHRRAQALQRATLQKLRNQPHLGSCEFFEQVLPQSFLQSIASDQRHRDLDQITVFWAFIWQILDGNASCRKALTLIQSWRQRLGLPSLSSNTASYCAARKRLNFDFIMSAHKRVLQHSDIQEIEDFKWKGFRLKAIDGSSVQLMDTQENQELYPQSVVQKKGCGFPIMGFVGLVDLGQGIWQDWMTAKHTEHDLHAAFKLIKNLNQGDVLLGDRAFCSYDLIAKILERGAHIVMRLHQSRARFIDMRNGKCLGLGDREVVWKKPPFRPNGGPSREVWKSLPQSIRLRIVKSRAKNREGKWTDYYVVTSLLDPWEYPSHDITELYLKRWEIELRFRDYKSTLGMEKLEVKTPDAARKALAISILAHNLLRLFMTQGAKVNEICVSKISFKGALDLVLNFRYLGHQKGKEVIQKLFELVGATQVIKRPGRQEPRAQKRRHKNFQLLTKPRKIFREIQHRGKNRKLA